MNRGLLISASVVAVFAMATIVVFQTGAGIAIAAPFVQDADRVAPDVEGDVGVFAEADDGRQREFTPDLVERIIDVARDVDPPMAERLRALCDHQPQDVERVIRSSGRRLLALADLKQRDPKLYDLKTMEIRYEAQAIGIANQIALAQAHGEESRERTLREEMLQVMRMQVGVSLAARKEYLVRLQQHLQAMEEDLNRDTVNFDETVRKRIDAAVEQARAAAGTAATARSR